MKKQRNILQGIQRQGRLLFVVCGSGILLVALLVAGFAYAAAVGQNRMLANEDALNKIASAQKTHVPTTHTPVVHISVTSTAAMPTVIAQATVAPTPVVQATQAPVAPTPVPQAPVSSPPTQVSGSYADMIYQVFGSAYGAGAVNIAMCESSMNPNAYNGVLGASGLFQIIPSTFASTSYAGQSVFNPLVNIEAAHEIFARDGDSWSEWQCQP